MLENHFHAGYKYREIKTEYNMKNITSETTESVRDLEIVLDNT